MMQRMPAAESPAAYVAALTGWQKRAVTALRRAVKAAGWLDEEVKWGHLVYSTNGPALLIRAERTRVLFGFWRGRRLREIEPRLKASGKYEMATLELREETTVPPAVVRHLVRKAVSLNRALGNPQDAARPRRSR